MVQGDPRIGSSLKGGYRLLKRIGEGSMATVYQAEAAGTEGPTLVAVKFLRESFAMDEDGRRRFEVEARAMRRLSHPNCVSILDYGVEGESPYLVLDFITGQSLRDVLNMGEPIAAMHALDMVSQILRGLTHVHLHGIIHRDLKPENVLVSGDSAGGMRMKIVDFGLAKLRDELTVTTGIALGTPSYMSPEQTIGKSVDVRADVYTVGIILFELLVGHKPYRADSPFDLMRMHREAPIPTLKESVPGARFSKQLEATIQTALAKKPEKRFDSADAFVKAISRVPEAQPQSINKRSWWMFWRD